MSNSDNHIVVFEHESVRFDKGEKKISQDQFKALQRYYGEGVPFFSLIHNGVKFNEHVGVIQIGKTIIEVLPKADKNWGEGEDTWRTILVNMLRAVGGFEIKSTSDSNLKVKANSVLDLYFEMFVKEVEYLMHAGLIKKYRQKQSNVHALKGSLVFGKHILQNVTHQERFYVRYTTYDLHHPLHFILSKSLNLLKNINWHNGLNSRIGNLLLNFPPMPDIKITETTFSKLIFNRKSQPYKKAIDISRLLLLNYHPDVTKGRNNVLALMFDMNLLWEQFVYASLRKHKSGSNTITAQTSKYFWQPEGGYKSKMRPDIILNKDEINCIVLDTKWKNLNGCNPSPEDLRQMYVYHEYYKAKKVALLYPGKIMPISSGTYLNHEGSVTEKKCSIITIPIENNVREWQKNIAKMIDTWAK